MIDKREVLKAIGLGLAVVLLSTLVMVAARADALLLEPGWPVVSEEVGCG